MSERDTDDSRPLEIALALLKQKMDVIDCRVQEIKEALDQRYVTQAEFAPVRGFVYATITLVTLAVFGALLRLVILNGA